MFQARSELLSAQSYREFSGKVKKVVSAQNRNKLASDDLEDEVSRNCKLKDRGGSKTAER